MHGIGYYNNAIGDTNAKIKSKVSDTDSGNFLEKVEGHVLVAIKLGNLLLTLDIQHNPTLKFHATINTSQKN